MGADGGIAKDCRNNCFLFDKNILIDAGTGLGDLDVDSMAKIDYIFLTHVHMGHIACLPLVIDTVFASQRSPITIYVPGNDRGKLLKDIFNDVVWLNFTRMPSPASPVVQFKPMVQEINLGGRRIGMLPANHHSLAVGLWINRGDGTLVFTGNMGPCGEFWLAYEKLSDVTHFIVECSFPNELEDLAHKMGHLTPALLEQELKRLNGNPQVFANLMKPATKVELWAN